RPCSPPPLFSLSLFNDPATTELPTLSLHDALPISAEPTAIGDPTNCSRAGSKRTRSSVATRSPAMNSMRLPSREKLGVWAQRARSEEHTSELQSLTNLVCRLLLEKKKNKDTILPNT